MAKPLHLHSRLVFWLKIALPLLALAILSTLFLFARRIEFEGTLPYAQVEIDSLASDPRLTKPEYSGVTSDGVAVRVAAGSARPGPEAASPVKATDVVALYEGPSGARMTISAVDGIFDTGAAMLTLNGNVVLSTSDGYVLRSEQLLSALNETLVTSDGKVMADAPLGHIEAGAMRLSGPTGEHLLVFKNGVRLVYKPES